MNDNFPKLNLEKFAHGYQSFYATTLSIISEAENSGVLTYLLTEDINSQYNYSDEFRNRLPMTVFLKKHI